MGRITCFFRDVFTIMKVLIIYVNCCIIYGIISMRLCARGGFCCMDIKSLIYLLIFLVNLYLVVYVDVLEHIMMHI